MNRRIALKRVFAEAKPLVTVVVVAFVLSLPLLWFGFPAPTHDGAIHILWSQHLATAFWNGEAYPRWLPELNRGFGTPAFFFYPPASSFAGAAFWPLAPEYGRAWFALGWGAALGLLVSGVGMFCFLRRELAERGATSGNGEIGDAVERVPTKGNRSEWIAVAGAVLYMAAPYHLGIDLFERGANAEFWAFTFMPLVLLAFRGLASPRYTPGLCPQSQDRQSSTAVPAESDGLPLLTPSERHGHAGGTPVLLFMRELLPCGATVWAVLALAALFCTHLLTAITFAPVAAIFAASFGAKTFRRAVVAGLWAVLLCAVYLLPMAFYGQYTVAPESPFFMGEFFGHSFFFPQLSLTRPLSRNDPFNRRLLIVFLGMALVMVAGAGASLRGTGRQGERQPMLMWTGLLGFCLLMMLPVAEPVYAVVPGLKRIQFVWRFLSPATLVACVIVAMMMEEWTRRWRRRVIDHNIPSPKLAVERMREERRAVWPKIARQVSVHAPPVLGLLGLLIPLAWVTTQTFPAAFRDNYGRWRTFPPVLDVRSLDANGEYVPQSASVAVAKRLFGEEKNLAPADFQIVSGRGQISVEARSSRELVLQASAVEDMQVVWHQFWFPGWQALAGTNALALSRQAESGLLEMTIPKGQRQVVLRLAALWPEKAGIWISSLTAAFMAAALWWHRRQKQSNASGHIPRDSAPPTR